MNLLEFYKHQEKSINGSIANLSYYQKGLFSLLICERLLPSYSFFHFATNTGHPYYVAEILQSLKSMLLKQNVDEELLEEYQSELMSDRIASVFDFSPSMFANWAQDAITVISRTIEFLLQQDDSKVVSNALDSFETIEKFYYENFGLIEDENPEYDSIMKSYHLFQAEERIQQEHISILKDHTIISEDLYTRLAALQPYNRSNIGLS